MVGPGRIDQTSPLTIDFLDGAVPDLGSKQVFIELYQVNCADRDNGTG